MNSKIKINRIYLPFLLVAILISTSFRIAAMFLNFNLSTGYYDSKTLINISWAAIVSGCAVIISYAFVGNKSQKLLPSFATAATYVPTGAVCAALLFFAYFTTKKLDLYEVFVLGKVSTIPEILLLCMLVLSILSVPYFMLNACVFESSSKARAMFGLATVILLAFYASYLYFDTTLPINSPNKIVDQMAYILSALFFLYEIRISLGRECWHIYMTLGFLSALFTSYSSIPSLLIYLTKGISPSNNIYETALTLAVFIFVISRIILAATLKEDKESEIVAAMRVFATERDDEIKEAELRKKQAYLELYNTLNNISSQEEAENESTEESGDSMQISFDEFIESIPEQAEEEFLEEQQTPSEEVSYTEDGFIQESIAIPASEETTKNEEN